VGLVPAVTLPLASTVTDLYVPALAPEFASVSEPDAFADPSKETDQVASPVTEISLAVANLVEVAEFPSTLPEIVLENVFVPAIVCVPVVINPLLLDDASGMLNVCVLVEDEILKSVPEVPVANVCVVAVKLLSDVIPPSTEDEMVTSPVPVSIPVEESVMPVPAINRLTTACPETVSFRSLLFTSWSLICIDLISVLDILKSFDKICFYYL
jgi:hypothetical protein